MTTTTRRALTPTVVLSAALALSVTMPLTASAGESEGSSARVLDARGEHTDTVALAAVAERARSPFAQQLEAKYVDPDRIYSSDARWWLGEAAHTDETLLEEIQALYDGGYRGVELAMQNDNGAPNEDYAYGSAMWTHKWNLLMNKLLDLGMSVYLTSGTNWDTSNVPGLDPTSESAMQSLVLGTETVAADQSVTTLPAPDQDDQREGAEFETAYAYRVVEGDTVDPDSFVDLSENVTQGGDVWTQNLDWTAPSDGTYRIFSMWKQGTFQASNPAAEPSYATNYFDERGVEALKTFWEDHYLSDPELADKILDGDVQLFMDSLEIELHGGLTFWAEDMAEEFEKRKGYDITPYLFLTEDIRANVFNPYDSVETTGTYRFEGDDTQRQKIVNDYQDVLTQLYMERMLRPLKKWLNSVGIETRAQISYGKPIENSEPIMEVDYPEAENFNQYNQVDIFRLWTGGSKLENKVLSSESSAQAPVYTTPQLHLRDAYSTYAAGFQRIIWHVWSAGFGYGNYEWPGFVSFGGRFHQPGSRHPYSRDYDEYNAHLGRVQQLMQTGQSRTDVGFVHQNWAQGVRFGGGVGSDNTQMNWQLAHQGVYYRSTELQDNGYTYDYFSPRFLFDDDVSFDRATKTIEKAGYKAIVLYQDWLDIHGARRILDWAKKGLKVVILDDAASTTPHNDGKDAVLKKITDELKTLPTVRTATVYDDIDYHSAEPGGYSDNVIDKLRELGVKPYSGYSEPNLQLLNQTRQDTEGNRYVYLYNYGDDEYHKYSHKPSVRNLEFGPSATTDVEMDGTYVPYTIDAWTGEVTELADYRWEGGKTIVPVDVKQNDIALMAFEKVDVSEERLHVVSTNGESSYATGDGVAVRAIEPGEVRTELSDGTAHVDAVEVPESFDITDWDLTVESWRPNETSGDLTRTETIDGLETTNRKTSTDITEIDVELDTLKTWDEIPEVGKAVSGTGHYEATFDWDADAAEGAYLDLGDTFESTMEVWINGRKVGGEVSTNPTKVAMDVGGVDGPTIDDGTGTQVPLEGEDLYTGGVSWVSPTADVSEYLVDGQNEIVIEYSSGLSNVQLDRGVISPEEHSRSWWKNTQDYQSFGPQQAVLVPFAEVTYGEDEVVEKAATRVKATVKPKRVKPRVRPRLAIQVVARGKTPEGRIVVRKGSRQVAARVLNRNGRAVVRLPRMKPGVHRYKVVYAGAEEFKRSAKVVRIRVRR